MDECVNEWMNEWTAVAGSGEPTQGFYQAKASSAQYQKGAWEQLEYLDTLPRYSVAIFLEEQKPKQ